MTTPSGAERTPLRLDPDNPWPGLDSFDEQASDYFHGRNAEAEELLRRVVDAPLTVLFGKSGLGKTSLLKAGLFPRLRQRHFLPVLVRLDIRPGAGVLMAQVREALRRTIEEQQVDAPAFAEGETLWEYLHRSPFELWSTQNYLLTPVLVIDQFEEVFTLGERLGADVERFRTDLGDLAENRIPDTVTARIADAAQTGAALDLRGMPYKVILTLREDFLPHLEGWRPAIPSLGRSRVRLLPMRPEQALSAVYDTAPHLMDRPLARRIVAFVAAAQTTKGEAAPADAAAGEIEPALLSLFCRGLNERRKSQGQERFDDRLLEGVQQSIIADYYQSCVNAFPESVSRFIESELITGKGFRNSFAKDDAVPQHLTAEQLNRLIDRRLLRVEERYGAERIELTHDVLTPAVLEHRIRRQAEDERAALARQEAARRQALEAQARQQRQRVRALSLVALVCIAMAGLAAWRWRQSDVDRRLAEAERARAQAAEVKAYEALNLAAKAKEAAENASKTAYDEAAAARLSEERAQEATRTAEYQARLAYSRELAATAAPLMRAADQDPAATLLALGAVGATHAFDGTTTREAEDALRRAVGGAVTGLSILGHLAPVRSIGFAAAGTEVATCANDTTIVVWNAATGDALRRGDTDGCDGLAFGATDVRVADNSFGGTRLVVKDIPSGRTVLDVTRSRGSQIQEVAMSADGKRLAASDAARNVSIWDLGSGEGREILKASMQSFGAFALSADGNRVAIVADVTIRVLDVSDNGRVLRSIPDEGARELALNRDGSRLAVHTPQKGVRVWDVGAGTSTSVPQTDSVVALAFGGVDSQYLAAAGSETVTVWDATTGKLLRTVNGRAPIAFSADGARIAVSSDATAATIADIATGRAVKLHGRDERPMRAVALSADGSHIATASEDKRVRVWHATSGKAVLSVLEQGRTVFLATPPSGDRVAGWADQSAPAQALTIWHARGAVTHAVPRPNFFRLFDMRFTRKGDRLVTGGSAGEGFLTIWDAESGLPSNAPYAPTAPESGRTIAFAFSADERRIALSTTGGLTVRDVASGAVLLEVRGHWDDVVLGGRAGEWLAAQDQNRTEVWDVNARKKLSDARLPPGLSFTPLQPRPPRIALHDNGRLVAIADKDQQTVGVWDAVTGVKRSTFYRHGGKVRAAAFSPDGEALMIVADDWTVHRHPMSIAGLITLARQQVNRALTPQECQRYLNTSRCPAVTW